MRMRIGSCGGARHGASLRGGVRIGLAVALAVLAAGAVRGEDSDLTRYYFGIHYGDVVPGLVKAHDVTGGEIGVNLGRYFGIELALDSYEVKVGEVAESSVLGLLPQARLRYPFYDNRLVPYLIAGVGLAVTQGNDARAQVDWVGGKNGVLPMGSAGGGIDYFVADNLSVGLQGKYLASGDIDYSSGGVAGSVNASSAILAARLPRLLPGAASRRGRGSRGRGAGALLSELADRRCAARP